ncbi:TetR/AcrR family transcriptional regulator [Streptomyces triticagri]|uniref:TetR/AcrR family transcriptional regulator n=1 Tax=Streptomyces triticagri TaxID=2293568 RepID=A0A372M947_9ACTN|nr:TetR/AcrR family transcriptional regulator [Streptomyces triticagri]RFU87359.1 TetR/AcrR family transcriptional regulator [Streptomyces triticagri]
MTRAADRSKRPLRTSVWLDGRPPAGDAPRGDAPRGKAPEGRAPEGRAPAPTPGGARRPDQPTGLDLHRIVTETVALLDTDGLASFSMRKLAGRLGVTAMSVYWYVDTKDDLLELALDEVFAELPPNTEGEPIEASPDWWARLRALAHGYRAVLVRHPWVTTLIGNYLNVGPRSKAFSLAVQRVIRDTGLPPERRMGAIGATFQFVYGFGTIEGHFKQRCATAGMTQDEYYTEAIGSIRQSPEMAGYLESADEILAARGEGTVEELRERDFEVALDILIAGIEATTARG